jgi:transposase, IS5 family
MTIYAIADEAGTLESLAANFPTPSAAKERRMRYS